MKRYLCGTKVFTLFLQMSVFPLIAFGADRDFSSQSTMHQATDPDRPRLYNPVRSSSHSHFGTQGQSHNQTYQLGHHQTRQSQVPSSTSNASQNSHVEPPQPYEPPPPYSETPNNGSHQR